MHANWTSQLYTQTRLLSYTCKLDSEEYSGRVEYSPSKWITTLSPSLKSDFIIGLSMDCPLWLTTEEIFSQYDFPRKLLWVWQRTGMYSEKFMSTSQLYMQTGLLSYTRKRDFSAIHENWTSQLYMQTGLWGIQRTCRVYELIRTARTVPVVLGTVRLDTHVIEVVYRTVSVRTYMWDVRYTYGTWWRCVHRTCVRYTSTIPVSKRSVLPMGYINNFSVSVPLYKSLLLLLEKEGGWE